MPKIEKHKNCAFIWKNNNIKHNCVVAISIKKVKEAVKQKSRTWSSNSVFLYFILQFSSTLSTNGDLETWITKVWIQISYIF